MTTTSDLLDFKKRAMQQCLDKTQATKSAIEAAIQSATDARDNETKSSVGDKYETGRAHMQNEIDRLMQQLANINEILTELSTIKVDQVNDSVDLGSLAETNLGYYFICSSIGKVEVDGTSCYCISQQAPLARALIGAIAGEDRVFNGRTFTIRAIG